MPNGTPPQDHRPAADVTVVIPTRNRLGMLAQTLHTVLEQTVPLEVVVVDEGSTDDTPAWLAAHADPRVRTVRHDDPRGLSEARNAGIEAADTPWVAFTDDDDLWLPTKLSDQLDAAERDDAPWAFGGSVVFTDEPRLLRITVPPEPEGARRMPWANRVPGGGSNAIVRRDLLDEVGGFDPTVNAVADWDMWIRLVAAALPAVVPTPVLGYRIHTSNMSGSADTMMAQIAELDRRYRHLRGGEPIDWANVYNWMWGRTMTAGDLRSARRLASTAVRRRHPGAPRRLLRSLVPMAGRPPRPDASEVRPLDTIRPRVIVPWPPGVEGWLRRILSVTP